MQPSLGTRRLQGLRGQPTSSQMKCVALVGSLLAKAFVLSDQPEPLTVSPHTECGKHPAGQYGTVSWQVRKRADTVGEVGSQSKRLLGRSCCFREGT